jgi:hypothetical protein
VQRNELWTLEDLFYNSEDLTSKDVVRWLRMKYPSVEVDPEQVAIIMALYDGWKRGTIFVDGDLAGLREWRSN